jgi:glycosyltransferase involved in cell wall biosynthesis
VGGSGERDEAATSDVSVSILVCTRNRPESLERALRSLLASEDVVFELVVVDQSNGDATRRLIDGIDDCRVRYHRSNTRGLGPRSLVVSR